MLSNFENADKPYWKLDENDQQQILSFAESGNSLAHQEAKNILAFYYGYTFEDEMPEFNEPKSANFKKPATGPLSVSSTLKVYPNPSRGQTIFEYRYPSILVDLYLEIYTNQGSLLEKIRLLGTEGVYVWDGEKQASGSYLYKVSSGGKTLGSGLIQINK